MNKWAQLALEQQFPQLSGKDGKKENTDLQRVLKCALKNQPPFCCSGGRVSAFGGGQWIATELQ